MGKDHHDPVTGDPLTTGEYISWKIQGIIRNWAFLGIITVATALCWATRDARVLTWWNLGASYLALVIESIVGLAMFGQTRRDAVVLRLIKRLVEKEERELHAMQSDAAPPKSKPLRDPKTGRFVRRAA